MKQNIPYVKEFKDGVLLNPINDYYNSGASQRRSIRQFDQEQNRQLKRGLKTKS